MNARTTVSFLKILSFALIVSTTCSSANTQSATTSFELLTTKEQLSAAIKVLTRLQQTQEALLQNSKTSFIGTVGKELSYALGAVALGASGTSLFLESLVGTDNYKNALDVDSEYSNYWREQLSPPLNKDYLNDPRTQRHDKALHTVSVKAIPAGIVSIIGSYILLKIIFKGLLGTSTKNDTAAIQESLAQIDETLIKLMSAARALENPSVLA